MAGTKEENEMMGPNAHPRTYLAPPRNRERGRILLWIAHLGYDILDTAGTGGVRQLPAQHHRGTVLVEKREEEEEIQ